jgi:hypothetical protein
MLQWCKLAGLSQSLQESPQHGFESALIRQDFNRDAVYESHSGVEPHVVPRRIQRPAGVVMRTIDLYDPGPIPVGNEDVGLPRPVREPAARQGKIPIVSSSG